MPLKIGVAGVGALGFHHARILREIADVNVVGIHDIDSARLGLVAEELGLEPVRRLEDLLERVNALVVAVPTLDHEAVALVAIAGGVHILIEKPIAPTLEAADRILAAAEHAGVIIQIGHVERFNSALRACEPYVDSPLFVESHRLAPFGPRGTDVAVVLDLMIHDLDLVLTLVKQPVTSISAVGVPVLTHSPDIANARLEFAGGGVANLTASRISLERMRKLRLFQRSGYISIDLAAGHGSFLRLKDDVELTPGMPIPAGSIGEIVESISLRGDGAEPLRAELESFVNAVQGRASVAVTGDDGRRALAVALDIMERIGRYVALEPIA